MRVLFFVPSWATQGDLFFSYNAFKNHLLPQAKTLAGSGVNVTIAIGEGYVTNELVFPPNVDVIEIDQFEALKIVGGFSDPSVELYTHSSRSPLAQRLADWLGPQLPKQIDIVMLWETPVPYLRLLYPDVLIVNQMPGVFSREPYPHTVVFDPRGLYKDSVFYQSFDQIANRKFPHADATAGFIDKAKEIFEEFDIFKRDDLLKKGEFSKLALLPLQISQHYAFRADTDYKNQQDFLLDAINSVDDGTGIVVTQYVSRMYTEKVLDTNLQSLIEKKFGNIIYDQRFEGLPTISQYLLPNCDVTLTASSSLGLQGLVWDKPISVFGETYLGQLDTRRGNPDYSPESLLSFMLGHQQPLAKRVVDDSGFLIPLLEEMALRNTENRLNLPPSFEDIDSDYFDKLLGSFRTNNVKKLLHRKKYITIPKTKANQFRQIIEGGNLELISFDIFDTLITRRIEQPADTYKILERKMLAADLPNVAGLASKRLEAELRAREVTDRQEITLNDIYVQLRELLGWSEKLALHAMDIELDLEVFLSRPRPIGKALWQIALESRIPIILISDMYLPQSAIEKMLKNCGYGEKNQIFLSSTLFETKKEGSLYDYMLKTVKIKPARIMHIGDNLLTDIKSASVRGIQTFHIPRPTLYLHEHKILGRAYSKRRKPIEPLSRSLIAGLVGGKLFDDPHNVDRANIFSGDLYKLGYCGLGPVIVGYMSWLAKTAHREGIDNLYFLSREGKILKEVFEILTQGANTSFETKYLFGSRRAIRFADIRSLAGILDLCHLPIARGASLGGIIESRFSIRPNEIPSEILDKHGFVSASQSLGIGNTGTRNLISVAKDLADEIIKRATREREIYLSYLQSEEFGIGENYAVVDIGWNANMQGALGSLLNKKLSGFYYATLHGATTWSDSGHSIFAYHSRNSVQPEGVSLLTNRLLFEYLVCEGKGSVIRIEKNDAGEFRAVRNEKDEPPLRRELTAIVHEGILDFTRDMAEFGTDLILNVDFDPNFCEGVMREFLRSPSVSDAKMLEEHYLEDIFGGLKRGYFITPKTGSPATKTTDIYWKAGNRVIQEQTGMQDPARPAVKYISFFQKLDNLAVWIYRASRDVPFAKKLIDSVAPVYEWFKDRLSRKYRP